jgi:hypothetical protein
MVGIEIGIGGGGLYSVACRLLKGVGQCHGFCKALPQELAIESVKVKFCAHHLNHLRPGSNSLGRQVRSGVRHNYVRAPEGPTNSVS